MQYTDWMSQAEATSNVLPHLTVMVNKLLHQAVQDTSYNNTCRSVLATRRKKRRRAQQRWIQDHARNKKDKSKCQYGGIKIWEWWKGGTGNGTHHNENYALKKKWEHKKKKASCSHFIDFSLVLCFVSIMNHENSAAITTEHATMG